MEIVVTKADATTILAIQGSVDSFTADQLTASFSATLNGGCTLLLADLSAVEYISSAGLRALLIAAKDARMVGGDLRLAGARSAVQRVLSLSGFTSIINVYDDVPGGLASFALVA